MAARALSLLSAVVWVCAAPAFFACGETEQVAGARRGDAPDAFPGTYRVKGLTTDLERGDSRRIEGIVVLSVRGDGYGATADLETKYPSEGGSVDAHVIATADGRREGDELRGIAETQLVMSTVPGVHTDFAFVPRTVGPRLVSTWKARFRGDGTLLVELENQPAEGETYSPTRTTLYGTRIQEPKAAADE